MLKIGKGLKKKKKSKKNKHKEDELFTEEELQQYKREHAQKPTDESGTSAEAVEEKPPASSEELEKFKLLTAGVDDILRKSQGDLDRIKKESFFQRKPTPSEIKAQQEKERAEQTKEEGNWIGFEEGGKRTEGEIKEEQQEESESEYEFEENDDLFDTTYVDAIESGEVKLAYIPDDDEIELDEGPDPFDTTSAGEVLKKVEEEERKKKKQISLGSAVQVLTGRAERDKSLFEETGVVNFEETGGKTSRPRARPRKIQDFSLLGSFDDNGNPEAVKTSEVSESVSEVPKSLLDDDLNVDVELPEGDVLITDVLVKQIVGKKQEAVAEEEVEDKDTQKEELKGLVSEFEGLDEKANVKKAEEEEEFDEFTALATSSVAHQKLEEELHQFEDLEEDPFDTSAANAILKEPETNDPFGNVEGGAPVLETSDVAAATANWSAFDAKPPKQEVSTPVEVDPFDTTFAENIQPGKCELKLLENEILGDIVATDNSSVAHKTDIHQEARILSRSNSDFDFNPREGEVASERPNSQSVQSTVSIQITDPSGLIETQRGSESETGDSDLVSLSFSHRDLLGGSTSDLSQLGDHPLPPTTESPLEDFSKYSDPFDTSIVDQIAAPGKAELRFIEKELLQDIPPSIPEETLEEDDDFDPRSGEEKLSHKEVSFDIPSSAGSDLLSSVREEGTRPLTPFYAEVKPIEPEAAGESYDPFDTSHATSLPGKEELKLIEKELETVEPSPAVFVPIHKQLGIEEETDVLQSGLKHSLSDQEFNPRGEEKDVQSNALTASVPTRRYSDITGLAQKPRSGLQSEASQIAKPDLLLVEEEITTKALTPSIEEDISGYVDPFDTSIAENIVPGKAELKVLENELITDSTENTGGIKRSYTDPDFNPRDEILEKEELKNQIQTASDILSLPEDSVVGAKPLTPLDFEEGIDDIDPFDTSIATNLLPGKAELRVLESELFGQ